MVQVRVSAEYEIALVYDPNSSFYRMTTSRLYVDPEYIQRAEGDEFAKWDLFHSAARAIVYLR